MPICEQTTVNLSKVAMQEHVKVFVVYLWINRKLFFWYLPVSPR